MFTTLEICTLSLFYLLTGIVFVRSYLKFSYRETWEELSARMDLRDRDRFGYYKEIDEKIILFILIFIWPLCLLLEMLYLIFHTLKFIINYIVNIKFSLLVTSYLFFTLVVIYYLVDKFNILTVQ